MADGPSVTVETFRASDGYLWKYRRYLAAGPRPRGHVICLHGIQSHSGWYARSCTRLADAGFHVDFLDRRGSGMNDTARGDAPSFRRLLDDIAEFLHAMRGAAASTPLKGQDWGVRGKSELPSPLGGEGSGVRVPVVLIAISWGGKLGVALQRRHPGLIDGLALLCPGIFPKVRTSFLQRLSIACTRLFAPTRRFPIPLNDPELFTATAQWQQFIRQDPLALREATARLLLESVRLDIYLRWAAPHVRIPVLLMLAENDRIIDNDLTRRWIDTFPTPCRDVIEYPGAHHTLEFEPDLDRFIDDLVRWVGQRCKDDSLADV